MRRLRRPRPTIDGGRGAGHNCSPNSRAERVGARDSRLYTGPESCATAPPADLGRLCRRLGRRLPGLHQMIMAPVAKNSRPNDPLSVLVLTDYYPPWIGGGQRASRELAVQLAARGYDVAVATVWQPGTPRFERDASVDVHRLSQSRTLLKPMVRPRQQHHPPFPDPVFVAGLRRILRRHNPSVVYAYGWVTYSFLVANVGLRIPLVLAALDYGYSCPTRTMLRDGAACSGPAFERCLPCASRHYGTPKGIATFLGVT